MSWTVIENLSPATSSGIAQPPHGVVVQSRSFTKRGEGGQVRYIRMVVGPKLASNLVLTGEQTRVQLALGMGANSGKVAISVDASRGTFPAKRAKDGSYVLTINARSAEGLFALAFAPFAAEAQMLPPERNKPPMACFPASADMLAAED